MALLITFANSLDPDPRGGGGGGGGYSDISCICRLGSFFLFNILNFNIFWGFPKNEYFWGMKILLIFF